jgi:hypothetical protein
MQIRVPTSSTFRPLAQSLPVQPWSRLYHFYMYAALVMGKFRYRLCVQMWTAFIQDVVWIMDIYCKLY